MGRSRPARHQMVALLRRITAAATTAGALPASGLQVSYAVSHTRVRDGEQRCVLPYPGDDSPMVPRQLDARRLGLNGKFAVREAL